jgi:cytoskeleton protein RodZ
MRRLMPVEDHRPIGARLREARMRQGLDLADCAAATRIRERYLVAIEDDRFESLPDPAYVNGFVRAYAAHLGVQVEGPERTLPAEGTVGQLRPRTVHVPATRVTARGVGGRPSRWRWVLPLLAVAVVAVALLIWGGVLDWPA